jgi:uncharacterized oligopeptide transporter (OPT) family protein
VGSRARLNRRWRSWHGSAVIGLSPFDARTRLRLFFFFFGWFFIGTIACLLAVIGGLVSIISGSFILFLVIDPGQAS